MPNRTQDLTTLDAFLIAAAAIASSEIIGRFFSSALPVMMSFCMLAVAISIRMLWPLRRKKWFIPFFLIVVFLHFPIAILMSKSGLNGFYMALTPFVGADVFIIIRLALKIDDKSY